MSDTLTLKIAETEKDAMLAFIAYKAMHEEGLVPGAFDAHKTLAYLLRWVKGPGSCVMLVMAGKKLAGILTLVEQAYWYGEDRHLIDKGLYVARDFRNSGALDILLDAAAQASDDLRLPCFIFRLDFKAKRNRSSNRKWKRGGNIMIHHPEA